jgi:hypothetical protein
VVTVVSPTAGLFRVVDPDPSAITAEGEIVEAGCVIAYVNDREVRSPCTGWFMGYLSAPDRQVVTGEPIAWVHGL